MEGLRIPVPSDDRRILRRRALVTPANLEEEFSLAGELDNHVVVELPQRRGDWRAATDPDVVLVIDGDPVFAVGPVKPGDSRPTPCVDKLSIRVEVQHGGRRSRPILWGKRIGPRQNKHVVMRIHGHRRHMTDDPVIGQLLRPRGIHLEHRHAHRLRRHRSTDASLAHSGGDHEDRCDAKADPLLPCHIHFSMRRERRLPFDDFRPGHPNWPRYTTKTLHVRPDSPGAASSPSACRDGQLGPRRHRT